MLGVCYYPEHWSPDIWADDARRMAALGLKTVRIAEFAWARMEPQAGDYQFGWLDQAIGTLGAAGLGVVLGTPTATPPKWLIDAYPDILPVDPATGAVRKFGSRRHYDFSSADYLRESLRIIGVMLDRYADNPHVIGWQTDNELTCHDTALSGSAAATAAFRDWCRARYGTIDALNAAWGNVFWSMEYGDFDALDLPIQTVCAPNPAHLLAWRRFASDAVARYHGAQVGLIRERAALRQFVTHNFIPYLDTGVDNFAICADIDFASYDSYPLGIADMAMARAPAEHFKPFMRTGLPDLTALNLDQTRGLSKHPYWLMEQQPGPVNWAPHNPRPAPGMVRLWTLQAFAHGAACVSYFRWRQAPFAQEQMHAGLLRPDSEPAEAWAEIEQVIADIAQLDSLATPMQRSDVALIIDTASLYVTQIEQQGAAYDYKRVVYQYYAALRGLGLNVDCVAPDADLSDYTLIVAPALAMPSAAVVSALGRARGLKVFGPRSGGKTAEFHIPDALPPGPLAPLCRVRVRVVETLRRDCPGELHWAGDAFESGIWRETLDVLDDGEAIATYEDGTPAIVRADRSLYIGTLTDDRFLTRMFAAVAADLGLATVTLPADLRITRRGALCFAFNYAAQTQDAPAPDGAHFIIGARSIAPYGVAVWRDAPNQ